VHRTPPLIFDPAAAQAWLRQPSDTHHGLTRADSLGVDDELTGRGGEGFLATVDDVLTAWPDGLHRDADITAVDLWLIPDGDILDQGALITVDLTTGLRLASLHQDIKDFADRDQHGIPAVLSALAHIADQASLLLAAYQHGQSSGRQRGVAMTNPDPSAPVVEPAPATFTQQQVLDALNEAANDILHAVHAGDEGLRDGINLMINATIAYLCGEADDLHDVVDVSYDEDYDTVLGWIEAAL